MATMVLLSLLVVLPIVFADHGDILQIHYPNISIEADTNGNVSLQSGAAASVYIIPGAGGSVYYDGEDLIRLIKVIHGLPPVWKEHSSVGFFYTAFGGDTLNVNLEATDPENGRLEYSVVAGNMPPGLRVDSAGSRITGRVPDADAYYSFTVRATNQNDKSADATFRMEIIERNQCINSPCLHGGRCVDLTGDIPYMCNCTDAYSGSHIGRHIEVSVLVILQRGISASTAHAYTGAERNQCINSPCLHGGRCVDLMGDIPYMCNCTEAYSGQDCEISCVSNPLGVTNRSVIPDAQMSAFLTRENFTASHGRLNNPGGQGKGWCGSNDKAWLQVDLGSPARIFSTTEQSYNGDYYTGQYYVSYSTDGAAFDYVYSRVGNTTVRMLFSGSSSTSASTVNLPGPITARFVRFSPHSFGTSYYPCMRVELNGCYEHQH